ncbi:MAG: nitroreductase family protein [Actinomycetota bacterium]
MEGNEKMDALAAINSRRSVRRFQEREPEEQTIGALLKAATRAPSAGNLQPWHFYAVRDRETRQALATAAGSQSHVARAPVVVVVCAEPERSARHYGDRGRYLYSIQDTAAATENLLLAATAMGLGSCWTGAFDEAAVARVLEAPEGRLPVVLVPLGYPERERASASSRRDISEVVTEIRGR